MKVTIWQVPYDTPGAKTIKHIHFGKNIKEFCMYDCSNFKNLETVEFDANVTWIHLGFFHGCMKLRSVTFGADSPVEHISSNCFSDCTALRTFIFPRNLKELDKSAFTGCDKLESITVYTPSEKVLESIVNIKTIKRISIIKNNETKIIGLNVIEELRKKYAIAARQRIKEEEIRQKFLDFDSYFEKRSKVRLWYHAVVCALPFLYYLYRYIDGTFQGVELSFSIILGKVIALGILFVVETIAWGFSCMLTAYVDYYTRENSFWISLFSPIVTVPVTLFLIYVALLVLSIVTTCSTGLAGIFDPRFL